MSARAFCAGFAHDESPITLHSPRISNRYSIIRNRANQLTTKEKTFSNRYFLSCLLRLRRQRRPAEAGRYKANSEINVAFPDMCRAITYFSRTAFLGTSAGKIGGVTVQRGYTLRHEDSPLTPCDVMGSLQLRCAEAPLHKPRRVAAPGGKACGAPFCALPTRLRLRNSRDNLLGGRRE